MNLNLTIRRIFTVSRGNRLGWSPISGTPVWGGRPYRLPREAHHHRSNAASCGRHAKHVTAVWSRQYML